MLAKQLEETLEKMKSQVNKNKEDIKREYALALNDKFGLSLDQDASNAGENLNILLEFFCDKTLRVFETCLANYNALQAKVENFDELKVVYGAQSYGGVCAYLLKKFPQALDSLKFAFGFLNPLGTTSFPEGVKVELNPTKRTFDVLIDKNKLENPSVTFELKADNAYTIKPILRLKDDFIDSLKEEDLLNPQEGGELDVVYHSFAQALHSIMPLARLYEGDIQRTVAEELNAQEFTYAWSLAHKVTLNVKIQFSWDTQENRHINTRQEIKDAFEKIVKEKGYGLIGKMLNLQDFACLAQVAGVRQVKWAWTSSDVKSVPNLALESHAHTIAVPYDVFVVFTLSLDDIEVQAL